MRASTSTTRNTWSCSPFIFYSIVISIVIGGRRMNDRCADLCARDRGDDGLVLDAPGARADRCSQPPAREQTAVWKPVKGSRKSICKILRRAAALFGQSWKFCVPPRSHRRETSAAGRARGAADRFGPLTLERGVNLDGSYLRRPASDGIWKRHARKSVSRQRAERRSSFVSGQAS